MKQDIQNIIILKNLNLSAKKTGKKLVCDLSLEIAANETLAIVGESGSGKSLTALTLMGLLDDQAIRIDSGELFFRNHQITLKSPDKKQLKKLRGNDISMIFQEPMTALNPSIRCGKQVSEMISVHHNIGKKTLKAKVLELFHDIELTDGERIWGSFPHQLSGGQRQRVMIAMALANKPALIIADEPTTALDASVRASIISLLQKLVKESGASLLFISHDLTLVEHIADRVMVMRYGNCIESAQTRLIFENPREAYTRALLECRPQNARPGERLKSITGILDNSEGINSEFSVEQGHNENTEKIVEVRNLSKWFKRKSSFFGSSYFFANKNISFTISKGKTLGVIGESGSGKTTLISGLLQLQRADEGDVFIHTKNWCKLNGKALRKERRQVQIVFQDPYSSLNPNMKVGRLMMELLRYHESGKNRGERKLIIEEMLLKCGLTAEDTDKYPHQFSGGQRQRIAIARALILQPEVLILDEPVSALDVSVQATIINLLSDLKKEFRLTYLFISHDIHLVRYFCDDVLVLRNGTTEDYGSVKEVLEHPRSKYVKMLLKASGMS